MGLALLVGVVAMLVAGVAPASAATEDPYTDMKVAAPTTHQNVVKQGFVEEYFAAGQTAYVRAVIRANRATYRILVNNEVRCFGPGGWTHSLVIGQNVYESPGDPWDDVWLTTRFLVHPGAAGTADPGERGQRVKVRPGDPAHVPSTGMFEVPAGTAGLTVFGDTEFQVDCRKPDGQECGVEDTMTASFRLYVNQWKTDSTLCFQTPLTVKKTVSYSVHHLFAPLNLKVPVETANGCAPKFNTYVRTDWLGGDPDPESVQGYARTP